MHICFLIRYRHLNIFRFLHFLIQQFQLFFRNWLEDIPNTLWQYTVKCEDVLKSNFPAIPKKELWIINHFQYLFRFFLLYSLIRTFTTTRVKLSVERSFWYMIILFYLKFTSPWITKSTHDDLLYVDLTYIILVQLVIKKSDLRVYLVIRTR